MQMTSDGPIKTRKEGAILEVTLDRPKANAIDLATSRIMGQVFRAFRMMTVCACAFCARRAISFSAQVGI